MNAARLKNQAARRELRLKMAVDRARLTTRARLAAAESDMQTALVLEKAKVYGSGALMLLPVVAGVAMLFRRKPRVTAMDRLNPLMRRLKGAASAVPERPAVALGRFAILLQVAKYLPTLIQLSRRDDVRRVLATRPWQKRKQRVVAAVDEQARSLKS